MTTVRHACRAIRKRASSSSTSRSKDGSNITRRFDGLPGLTDPTSKFRDATGDNPAFADIPSLVRSMSSAADLNRLLALLNQDRRLKPTLTKDLS
jgi:hypothetical protein